MRARTVWLALFLVFLIVGCTSKRGIVVIHTRPTDATIYVNDVKRGTSPVKFEYDFSEPADLRIEKPGYYTETETLSEAWVIREIRKGNYSEGSFVIQGETTRSWQVDTSRLLQKK